MYGLLIAIALLVLIIALTSSKRALPTGDNNDHLKLFSKVLFEESIFPVAIFTIDLKFIMGNKAFKQVFMSNATPVSVIEISTLWQNQATKQLLEHLMTKKTLPENLLFTNIELSNDQGEPENYIIVFRYVDDQPQIAPCITITAVNSRYTAHLAEDLVARIAEKESNLKKLEEVGRLKSEFLATLSHELKTPLVSIKGYLDLIASEKMGPLTEKQAKALQVSLKNTSHLNSMISSMLNFARMEAGKLMFDLVHQKLPTRINESLDSLRPIAENRNISLQTTFAADLPTVIFDPELMHRVVCNLVENAIKFSQPGSTVNIVVSQHSPNLVKVEISDRGCGIPADKLEMIKTPFYQVVRSDTRPTSGLGLGLAICEKILIGHGTNLTIESHENEGTVCSFFLKTAPGAAA